MNEEKMGVYPSIKQIKWKKNTQKCLFMFGKREKRINKRSFISWTIHTSATIQFNLPMITATDELKDYVCVRIEQEGRDEKRRNK